MEEGVIDIFEEGVGEEKIVRLEVKGKRIGSIHLGSEQKPGDPNRVVINLHPIVLQSGYTLFETILFEGRQEPHDDMILILEKEETEE